MSASAVAPQGISAEHSVLYPTAGFVKPLRRDVVLRAVDKERRTAPSAKAQPAAVSNKARPTPVPRDSGATKRSLRMYIRAIPADVKDGNNWVKPQA
jgi:hypothetical protein